MSALTATMTSVVSDGMMPRRTRADPEDWGTTPRSIVTWR